MALDLDRGLGIAISAQICSAPVAPGASRLPLPPLRLKNIRELKQGVWGRPLSVTSAL